MMLSTSVLCMKKKKKKTYSLSGGKSNWKNDAVEKKMRSDSGAAVSMLHVTEDTPPDMLAGAMDLTVHLPTGITAKMAVERSTPMMDLLVQITTAHHLQLSNYSLQALGTAPSSDHRDKILPYKPNTPIGTLDTQHIKVVPKIRTIPVPKNVPPGHQPFESTFRLKVHLPRNQLYVARVSRNVKLEDIMKKVCEEKNLDPAKYEFKHPGNLDETLDPKLTLSDYQITEIFVVAKGTASLSQAFSSSDIMALRKEEERKQMHNKTGGGVFNLIFRRGKSSMGSGSVSSDTRSISPTHSDDSRSVTPPGVVQKPILPPPKQDPPTDRPKPPQRKRKPAPKPPTQPPTTETTERNANDAENSRTSSEDIRRISEEKSDGGEIQMRRTEGGLVISHSRTSSDSSGYHEASVLSENCNTSLPRRPKSAFVGSGDMEKLSKMHSQSSSNLSKMASHSKSTMSLGVPGRKKKAAPPPPPPIRANPQIQIETASPVVASQTANKTATHSTPLDTLVAQTAPKPLPRCKPKAPQAPQVRPKSEIITSNRIQSIEEEEILATPNQIDTIREKPCTKANEVRNDVVIDEIIKEVCKEIVEDTSESKQISANGDSNNNINKTDNNNNVELKEEIKKENIYDKILELQKQSHQNIFNSEQFITKLEHTKDNSKPLTEKTKIDTNTEELHLVEIKDSNHNKETEESIQLSEKKLPEIVGVIPKTPKDKTSNKYDSFGKRRFQKSSITNSFEDDSTSTHTESLSSQTSVASALGTFNFIDEFSDLDDKVFSGSISSNKNFSLRDEVFNELYGIHKLDDVQFDKKHSISSLRSLRSLPGFLNSTGMSKWNNFEDLDDMCLSCRDPNSRWVIGESETESLASHQALDSLDSQIHTLSENIEVAKPFGSTDSGIAQETNEKLSETEDCRPITPPPPPLFLDEPPIEEETKNEERLQEKVEINDLDPVIEEESSKEVVQTKEIEHTNEVSKESSDLYEIDWQYQLPSPPKAFRDTSPVINDESTITDFKDSVVTSPELFEKEKPIDTRSTTTFDTQSVATFVGDEPPLNTLSLEHLEKRKSLVYNRELSTSLKVSDEDIMDPYTNSLNKFETTFIEVQKSSHKEISKPKYVQKTTHTLPNFKISTYDRPKEKIKVFEDDTIRSSQNSYATNKTYSQLNRYYAASSMENISIRKNSIDNKTGEREYTFYRAENGPVIAKNYGPSTGGFNTESFNTETAWSPGKLVSRSRSYLTLNGTNKHKVEKQTNGKKGIERSNSLYDISGLQSLGVMRLIQSKLNTPTSSLENLNFIEEKSEPSNNSYSHQKEAAPQEVVQKTAATEKIYKYQGPPSINMSTWSERPKVPVSVKEDEDYKLGNNISSKLIVNTTNNNITSNNSIEIKNGEVESMQPSISIKVNGTEIPTTTTESKAGNVVIKIGSTPSQPKIIDNQRFISHTTASGYRRPLTDINKNQRPHSIAFGSDIDISRVPVVRSVELKKPFKDFGNTSVTQIGSAEPTQQNNFYGRLKPTIVPVVRGFKTLPKEREAFVPNSQVPFSQGTLRRTASSNLYDEINANTTDSKPREVESVEKFVEPVESTVNPPPPPMMPKVSLRKPVVRHIEPVVDTRDQLLSAIRNFGGKKGLRPAKV